MQKQVFQQKELNMIRIKLLKTYWFTLLCAAAAILLTITLSVILVKFLFPHNTMLFTAIAAFGAALIVGVIHKDELRTLRENYYLHKVKRDVACIIREQYGYATDENIDSINKVVSIITKHSNIGEFRNASKEYYNLISLSVTETAVLYGDAYLRVWNHHVRLPLPA